MKGLNGNVDRISIGNTLNHMDGFPVAMLTAKAFFDTFNIETKVPLPSLISFFKDKIWNSYLANIMHWAGVK